MSIVQDIQNPQGTQEHTIMPQPDSQAQEILGAGRALSNFADFGSRIIKATQGQKDLGPLSRALQVYVDDVQGGQTTQSKQIQKYQSIVRWALSNGYTNADINATASNLGADIPWEAAKKYITRENDVNTVFDTELTNTAETLYPGMPLEKSKALTKSLFMDAMTTQLQGEAYKEIGLSGEMTFEEQQGAVLSYISSRLRMLQSQNGDTMLADDLTNSLSDVGQTLKDWGYPAEIVQYWTNVAYKLWEPTIEENVKKATKFNESLDQREKEYKHNQNMRDIREAIFLKDRRWGLINSVAELKDGKKMLIGDLLVVKDLDPTLATAVWDQFLKEGITVTDIFNSLVDNISPVDVSQKDTKMLMSTHYARLVDSSPNADTRQKGANAQSVAGKNWVDMAAEDARVKSNHMLERFNSTYILDEAAYQDSAESIQRNVSVTDSFLKATAEKLGLDMNNSLPLFDKDGTLRLYKVEWEYFNSAGGADPHYEVEDITEGYSPFSDRRFFDTYTKIQAPLFISRASTFTGLSPEVLRDRWNKAMVANSDVGKRIADNKGIRGRFFSFAGPLNSGETLDAEKTQEVFDIIMGEDKKSKRGRRGEMVFDAGNTDFSSYELKLPRGIRNNNPTNIKHNPKNKWEGASKEQTDDTFVQFDTPVAGLRAAGKVLNSYAKRGIDTLEEIAETWSAAEGKELDNYIKTLEDFTGLNKEDKVNLKDKRLVMRLLKGITFAENGGRLPYTDSVYVEAIGAPVPRTR